MTTLVDTIALGDSMFGLAQRLWPINRSITGDGVRQTLSILAEYLPAMHVNEVATGTTVFDWNVPKEWRVRSAYIVAPNGDKLCDFSINNLHLVGYSCAVNTRLSLSDLQQYLYSLPEQPDAIPYITSYYKERWGFCLAHSERLKLKDGDYHIVIDADLFDGHLTYGELLLPGDSTEEVFISTYICHPSMANNELSGPCVTAFLAQWVQQQSRRYSYRFVFIPETIGSITYLSQHKDSLKQNVIAGFNVSCVGDERAYSYLPSRRNNTLSDLAARHVLKHTAADYITYLWSERGSDERQYCAPGIDLPIASIMRSKYGEYPEYHTSLDQLGSVVTANGLSGGFQAIQKAIEAIERNTYPEVQVFGEPQLGKRGLYPTLSTKESGETTRLMMDLITWSDGEHSLLEIADLCKAPIWDLYPIVDQLVEHDLLTLHSTSRARVV